MMIVGDTDQLPCVGPGQVPADAIQSRAESVIRLTEITSGGFAGIKSPIEAQQ